MRSQNTDNIVRRGLHDHEALEKEKSPPMITPSQCRAARGLLDWTQQELANAARIGVATVRLFEGGVGDSRQATLVMLRQAFESAGVEFMDEILVAIPRG